MSNDADHAFFDCELNSGRRRTPEDGHGGLPRPRPGRKGAAPLPLTRCVTMRCNKGAAFGIVYGY